MYPSATKAFVATYSYEHEVLLAATDALNKEKKTKRDRIYVYLLVKLAREAANH